MKINLDNLTLGEVVDFEKATGTKVAALDTTNGLGGAELAAFVWIVKRREDPDFTYDDALKTRIAQLEFDDPNPTEASS